MKRSEIWAIIGLLVFLLFVAYEIGRGQGRIEALENIVVSWCDKYSCYLESDHLGEINVIWEDGIKILGD